MARNPPTVAQQHNVSFKECLAARLAGYGTNADGFAGAAFEEHVVRHDHGGTAVLLEQGFDVLDEVKLL